MLLSPFDFLFEVFGPAEGIGGLLFLENISAKDFDARFALLGATDGQQYDDNPVIGSRFLGNGEYVAANEAYGVVLTFIASGDDLPHPDADAEKLRKAKLRANTTAADASTDADGKKAAAPRATVTITDKSGGHIRTFTTDVHQGINRATWNLKRDGLPPLPGDKKTPDADLPDGIEVIPGTYSVAVTFDGQTQSLEAEVLVDPRVNVSLAAMQANQDMQLELQTLDATINDALSQIVTARRDLGTIQTLLSQAPDPEQFAALKSQVTENLTMLTTVEAGLRNPADTKGRPYVDGTASSVVDRAQDFLKTTYEAPSPTALAFAKIAEARVNETVSALNGYLSGDFAKLRAAFTDSALGLLTQEPVAIEASR
ncbi:MAG: carboxypeptidase-like regulatory domain-containing protein [Congregibacter sp.]|nr:carboxypeptidase-like regulatory domain-containing protein [Congregibacter sp.]